MKWFLLLTKRNFKKPSFIFILCLIPLITLAINAMTGNDSTMMRIGYTCENTPDEITSQLFEDFSKNDGMISYVYFDSEEEGIWALEDADIDTLWIFPSSLEKQINEFYSTSSSPVVSVLNREENEMSKLALEALYCRLYPHISYSVFADYMKETIPQADTLNDAQLKKYYGYKGINTEMVNIVTVDATGALSENRGNHLTSPLRAISAVMVMLAGLAAAIYTANDKRRGLFTSFTPKKEFLIMCLSVASSLLPASVTALLSIYFAGLFEGLVFELAGMAVFAVCCMSLCVLFLHIFKTPEHLGISATLFCVLSVVFSPAFVNISVSPVIQSVFPTYHYLYLLGDPSKIISMLIYIFVALFISIVLRLICCRKC